MNIIWFKDDVMMSQYTLKLKKIASKLWSGKFIFYLSDQKVFMVRIDNLSGCN